MIKWAWSYFLYRRDHSSANLTDSCSYQTLRPCAPSETYKQFIQKRGYLKSFCQVNFHPCQLIHVKVSPNQGRTFHTGRHFLDNHGHCGETACTVQSFSQETVRRATLEEFSAGFERFSNASGKGSGREERSTGDTKQRRGQPETDQNYSQTVENSNR